MQKRTNKRKKELNPSIKIIVNFTRSSIIGTLVCLLFTLIFSFILTKRAMLNSEIIVLIYFVVSVLIGALVNGFISSRQGHFKGIISRLISSILYSLLILIFMLIASGNTLNSYCFILIVGIVIFAAIGGILGANIKRKR